MKTTSMHLLGLLFAFGATVACSSREHDTTPPTVIPLAPDTPPATPEPEPSTEDSEGMNDVPIEIVHLDTPEALASACNALGLDLYGRVRSQRGNLAFSPLSLELAFSMVAAGARGDTETELWRVLHGGEDHAAMYSAVERMLASVGAERDTYELRIANRLFGQRGFAFEDAYLSLLREKYAAPLEPLQMTGAEDAARAQINGWVSEQTRQRIPALLPEGAIDNFTRLVLVNAIYFLGKWERPFRTTATHSAPFWADGSTETRVPTMHTTATFGYGAVDGVKVLEMLYRGSDLSMLVFLPDARDGLPALEHGLDEAKLARLTGVLQQVEVEVALPKWETEGARLPLAQVMKGLGAERAFDRARADLTGIAPFSSPADRLYISDAFHEAFVKVDEQGTEAVAATAGVVAVAAAAPMVLANEFIADHPFIFAIRDVRSGALLFLGRVVDPT